MLNHETQLSFQITIQLKSYLKGTKHIKIREVFLSESKHSICCSYQCLTVYLIKMNLSALNFNFSLLFYVNFSTHYINNTALLYTFISSPRTARTLDAQTIRIRSPFSRLLNEMMMHIMRI